jgi:hypothetical protein
MREDDICSVVDRAVATGNVPLWEHFIANHSPYTSRKGVYELRAHMRAQTRQSPDLLRVWARANRNYRQQMRDQHVRFGRRHKRHQQVAERRKEDSFAYLRQNRERIEAGQHWGWLQRFAYHYLYKDEKIEEIVDDPQTLDKALLNCFEFLTPHLPTLEMFSERRGTAIVTVLEAACLATFRKKKSLQGIALNILQLVKANGVGGSGYDEGEVERFEAELDSLIFSSDLDAIAFASRYFEPQLTRAEDGAVQLHVLDRGSVFARVKGEMALDWLTRYPNMPFGARNSLFSTAAVHADRSKLNALIHARCNDPADLSETGQNTRKFWLLRHFFFIVPTSEALWTEFSADPKSIFAVANCSGRFPSQRAEGWPQLGAEQVYRILDAFTSVWPKVNLPSSYGTGDPEEETAYRFLTEVIYQIGRDDPSTSIAVFDRILSDPRFMDFHSDIRSERVAALRKLALAGFRAPRPAEISRLLDQSKIASVEDMRALLIELLDDIQARIRGAATDPVDVFYSGGKRVDENTARNRIVEMLEARLNALNLGVVVEHQMADAKRCDFTASTSIGGSQTILVVELKGQWNRELYTAAAIQLSDRYTIYPGAAGQGVYLVLWFGGNEKVAGKKESSITSASELRQAIIASMPDDLAGRIDVFVLDVSRPDGAAAVGKAKKRRKAPG